MKYKKVILEKIQNKIDNFYSNIVNNESDYKQINNLTNEINRDYEGRVLLELLQNGYDAFDGVNNKMELILTKEYLYFANTGRAFNKKGFEAICKLGESNKDVTISIGNKGVGFKSILSVAESCIILSGNSTSGFDWQFEFSNELKDILGERLNNCKNGIINFDNLEIKIKDSKRFTIAKKKIKNLEQEWKNVSYLSVPFPVLKLNEEIAKQIRNIKNAGFQTIIVLKLKENAYEKLIEQSNELYDYSTFLFLNTLKELKIKTPFEEKKEFIIQRISNPSHRNNGIDYHKVNIQKESYIIAETITTESQNTEIKKAIIEDNLPESWQELKNVKINIAYKENEKIDGRYFIYFPTEKKTSMPFHINSSFVGHINRKEINLNTSLNCLLLKYCVNLYLNVIDNFKTINDITNLINLLPQNSITNYSSDKHFYYALTQKQPLQKWNIVPVKINKKITWENVSNTKVYPETWRYTAYSKSNLTKSCNILFADINKVDYTNAYKNFAKLCNISSFPDLNIESDLNTFIIWSELLLENLATRKNNIELINCFYSEFIKIFPKEKRNLLNAKKLLFCENSTIQKIDFYNAQVMLPPKNKDSIKFFPDFLSDKILFFNSNILVNDDLSRFLLDYIYNNCGKICLQYEFRELYEIAINKHLKSENFIKSIINRNQQSINECIAIINYLFNYYIENKSKNIDWKSYLSELYLPSQTNKWEKVTDLYFSSSWNDNKNITNGKLLSGYFDSIKNNYATGIEKLICNYSNLNKILKVKSKKDVIADFINQCGVKDYLDLIENNNNNFYSSNKQLYSKNWDNRNEYTLNLHSNRLPSCSYIINCDYKLKCNSIEGFGSYLNTQNQLELFFELIIKSSQKWKEKGYRNYFECTDANHSDTVRIDFKYTFPNYAFIPCKSGFKKIDECWFISYEFIDKFSFIEHIHEKFAKLITKNHLLFDVGLKSISESVHSQKLIEYLVSLIKGNKIKAEETGNFLKLYNQTWINYTDNYRNERITKILLYSTDNKLFSSEQENLFNDGVFFPDELSLETSLKDNKNVAFIFIQNMNVKIRDKIKSLFPDKKKLSNLIKQINPINPSKAESFFKDNRFWLKTLIIATYTYLDRENPITIDNNKFKNIETELSSLKVKSIPFETFSFS